MHPLLNERIARFDSPFRRLDEWLAGIVPNPQLPPINMSVGEPQDAPPSMLAETVAAHAHLWNRYPPAVGTPEFRRAALGYLERRYPATRGRIDPDAQVSPVTSSREGLYLAASIATSPARIEPLALMQNPFYQTYRVGAIMAGAEPRYLSHSGFPEFALDLAAVPARPPEGHCAPPRGAANAVSVGAAQLDEATLSRTSILYLCSPSNPDGRVLAQQQMRWAIEAARRHNFLVVFDECYAELYDGDPPQGALDALAALDASAHWLDNVLVLHSLSKRSSAAGLRSGFAVGAADVLAALNRVRLNGTSCTPLPLLAAATALWSEDTHVDAMRARLRDRKDMADRLLGGYPGYYRPSCGFFLWIKVDDGLALTRRLWRDFALRVLPGTYLTQPGANGANAGDAFVRIALVHDPQTTVAGLSRLAMALGLAAAASPAAEQGGRPGISRNTGEVG